MTATRSSASRHGLNLSPTRRSSLRSRVLLAVGCVVLLAVSAVGWLSSQVTRRQFERYQSLEERQAELLEERLETVGRRIAEVLLRDGADEARVELQQLASSVQGDTYDIGDVVPEDSGFGFLWLQTDGLLVASTIAELADFTVVRLGEGSLRLLRNTEKESRAVAELRLPIWPLPSVAGRPSGELYALPMDSQLFGDEDDGEEAAREGAFLAQVNRWLVAVVAAAGGLALLVTAWVTGNVLAPLQDLERGTRRLQSGDRQHRVPVAGSREVAQLATSFNAMADALARTEELRRNLVADVAHELRTPLTNLRCQLEAVQDGLRPADGGTVDSLAEEVLHLQQLVADLQDLALAEAGQLRLELQELVVEVELKSAVRAASNATSGMTAEMGEVPIEIDAENGLEVCADPLRLRQILVNLLINARRHNPPGKAIELTARLANGATGSPDEVVSINVRDHGAGIEPRHLGRIFDRFYRTDPSRQRATGGSGLGLAIVKQLVELQGGTIEARNAPGGGAIFALTLRSAGAD